MHRGWGRDNSAVEEWAQRKGIKINRYSAGGPQLCTSSRSDPGSHEPDAGWSVSTFKEWTGELWNAAYSLVSVIVKANLTFKSLLEMHSFYLISATPFLISVGKFCKIQVWKMGVQTGWLLSRTIEGTFTSDWTGWELSFQRNYYSPCFLTSPWFTFW